LQAGSPKSSLSSLGAFIEGAMDTHFTQLAMAVLGNKAGNKEDFDEFCSKVQGQKEEKNMSARSTQARSKQ
jgi:hypothetical protein